MVRVEAQGMAVNTLPAKTELGRSIPQEQQNNNKVGLKELVASKATKEDVGKAVEIANDIMKLSNYHLEFQLHEESGYMQVEVIDNVSKELIKEIPPEYMLELTARLKDAINKALGMFVDEIV